MPRARIRRQGSPIRGGFRGCCANSAPEKYFSKKRHLAKKCAIIRFSRKSGVRLPPTLPVPASAGTGFFGGRRRGVYNCANDFPSLSFPRIRRLPLRPGAFCAFPRAVRRGVVPLPNVPARRWSPGRSVGGSPSRRLSPDPRRIAFFSILRAGAARILPRMWNARRLSRNPRRRGGLWRRRRNSGRSGHGPGFRPYLDRLHAARNDAGPGPSAAFRRNARLCRRPQKKTR